MMYQCGVVQYLSVWWHWLFLLHLSSSDVGQREQEKARLEKLYQESDRRLDNLIQGSAYLLRHYLSVLFRSVTDILNIIIMFA